MAKKTAYEIVMEDRKKLVEKLIENMKQGYFITKDKLDINSLLPKNPISGFYYKGGNRLKLVFETIDKEYKDPRWLTFIQAQKQGWNIKKGEHGILCEKWIFEKVEKVKDEITGEEKEVKKRLDRPTVNYFTVFNGEQIEGIPKYNSSKNTLSNSEILEIVDDFIKSSEAKIKEVAQHEAYYNPFSDEIVLPLRESFKSDEAFMRTTLHEMCHSTGHVTRLNRNQMGAFGTPNYAKEELIAELGSFFTESSLGIKIEGEHFNDHSNYLKSWITALEEDYNELFRACAEAEKASNYLIERYKEYEKEKLQELNKIKIEKDPFGKLRVTFHWSEYNFEIPDETVLRGEKAYKFLEKMINVDIKQNIEQQRMTKEEAEGRYTGGLFYYKTKISIKYGSTEVKDHVRIDLGDLEFGGKTKVSEALEYRLNLYTDDLIKNAQEYVEMTNKIVDMEEKRGITPSQERTTIEELMQKANSIKEENKDFIEHLKLKEIEYKEKLKNKDVKREKRNRSRSKNIINNER